MEEKPEEKEVFLHPETGEVISKNAHKKLLKGAPAKKEKKEKPAPTAEKDKKEKKPPKPPREAEVQCIDDTPLGQFKNIDKVFPSSYQPKYVESAWQQWYGYLNSFLILISFSLFQWF